MMLAAIAAIGLNTKMASAGGASNTGGVKFDKNNFGNSLDIDNKYFPLKAGTTFTYLGSSDGVKTKDVFVVTGDTKEILGIKARVVHDTVYEKNKATEDTFDWFAQDSGGNVWYMGEATTDLETGSHEGSWEAGVNGAKAGIIMTANPQPGDTYNQEFLKGVAEDKATVIATDQSVCVPYGCFDNVLQIKETTPLEPGVEDAKYYAPGVGDIKEETVIGGSEKLELVSIS
jgi:hypothetical protein